MNKLAKIAPLIVILASAGSLFFAFKLGSTKKELKAQNQQLSGDLSTAQGNLRKAQAQLQQDAAQLQIAQTEVANANANMQAAQVKLGAVQQEADAAKMRVTDLEQQLKISNEKLASAEDTLKKIQEITKSDDLQSIDQIRDRLTALGDENKFLSEQLVSARDEKIRLRQEIEDLKETPVGIRGHVAEVQPRWNFLVLDIGESSRVRQNTQFLVYRDSKLVAKVQIVSVSGNTSVAQILEEYRRGTPRVGDLVVR